MSKEIIGKRLKELRLVNHITQAKAAQLFGCSRYKIYTVEKGRFDFTVFEMLRYLEAIGCTSASRLISNYQY